MSTLSPYLWIRLTVHRTKLDDSQVTAFCEQFSPSRYAWSFELGDRKAHPHYHIWLAESVPDNHRRLGDVKKWVKAQGFKGNGDQSCKDADGGDEDQIRLCAYIAKGLRTKYHGIEDVWKDQGDKRAADLAAGVTNILADLKGHVRKVWLQYQENHDGELRHGENRRHLKVICAAVVGYHTERGLLLRRGSLESMCETLAVELVPGFGSRYIDRLAANLDIY